MYNDAIYIIDLKEYFMRPTDIDNHPGLTGLLSVAHRDYALCHLRSTDLRPASATDIHTAIQVQSRSSRPGPATHFERMTHP